MKKLAIVFFLTILYSFQNVQSFASKLLDSIKSNSSIELCDWTGCLLEDFKEKDCLIRIVNTGLENNPTLNHLLFVVRGKEHNCVSKEYAYSPSLCLTANLIASDSFDGIGNTSKIFSFKDKKETQEIKNLPQICELTRVRKRNYFSVRYDQDTWLLRAIKKAFCVQYAEYSNYKIFSLESHDKKFYHYGQLSENFSSKISRDSKVFSLENSLLFNEPQGLIGSINEELKDKAYKSSRCIFNVYSIPSLACMGLGFLGLRHAFLYAIHTADVDQRFARMIFSSSCVSLLGLKMFMWSKNRSYKKNFSKCTTQVKTADEFFFNKIDERFNNAHKFSHDG